MTFDPESWYRFNTLDDLRACTFSSDPELCFWISAFLCHVCRRDLRSMPYLLVRRTRQPDIMYHVGECCADKIPLVVPPEEPCSQCGVLTYVRQLTTAGVCPSCTSHPILPSGDMSPHYVLPLGKYRKRKFSDVVKLDPQYARFFLVHELGLDVALSQYETAVDEKFILTFGNYIGLSLAEVRARDAWYVRGFLAQSKADSDSDRGRVAKYLNFRLEDKKMETFARDLARNFKTLSAILEKHAGPVTELPVLKIDRVEFTEYIDFIQPDDMRAPVMIGVDPQERPFVCVRLQHAEGQQFVLTLFQRYWDHPPFWVASDRAKVLEQRDGLSDIVPGRLEPLRQLLSGQQVNDCRLA